MFERQRLGHPLVLTTLMAILVLVSNPSIAIEIGEFAPAFELNGLDGEVLTGRYGVYGVPTEYSIDIDGVIRYRDGVPKYLAAHIPDCYKP